MDRKCFIYYIISVKIIQFNLEHHSAAVRHIILLFSDIVTVLHVQEIKILSKNNVAVFPSRNNPFVYIIHKQKVEWTDRCACFNTHSKYNGPETM